MHPTITRVFRSAIVCIAGLCAAGASQAQSYKFVDLGSGQAAGINDSNIVVGTSNQTAAMWNKGVVTLLYQGPSNNVFSYAVAINNQGQIAGVVADRDIPNGAEWNPSSYTSNYTYLSAPGNGFASIYDINNKGTIVGNSGGAPAFEITNPNATGTALNFPNGSSYAANAINNAGVVVGSAYSNSADNYVAVEWKNGNATVLNGIGSGQSAAYGINDRGTVVGATNSNGGGLESAVEWNKGKTIVLGGFGGQSSQANAINDAGLAVGYASNAGGAQLATLWRGTSAINLNQMLSPATVKAGWILTDATDINNNGWIVGDAINTKTGAHDGFVLEISPVPEADTWAMLPIGLAMIGSLVYLKRGRRDANGT